MPWLGLEIKEVQIVAKVLREFLSKSKNTDKELTDHGSARIKQRDISLKEIEIAKNTATKTGNITIKTGKYGTLQNHYRGSNGVTVIEETTGRNAGKVITSWRH